MSGIISKGVEAEEEELKEGFVGGMSGGMSGGISPGIIAVCFALCCPCIYQLINCTGYKGGWGDVFYVMLIMLVGAVSTILGNVNFSFGIIFSSIAMIGLWIYSSMNGVEDFLCPISAPGGLSKQTGGGKRGGKRVGKKIKR